MDVFVQIPPSGRFYPDLVQGDREFWGNGPVVDVWAEVYPLGSKLFLRYSARFQETGGDNTRFEGSNTVELYDVAQQQPDRQIGSILTPRYDQFQFTDKDTSVNVFYRGATTLINKLEIQGDEWGGWFGGADHPWVELTFNPAILRLTQPSSQIRPTVIERLRLLVPDRQPHVPVSK